MKEIGSEFALFSNEDYYFKRIKSLRNSVRFLRCGRDVIGYIANLLNSKSGVILMPAYCCASMVQPFVIKGWKVEYYPIKNDFSADDEYIVSFYKKNLPDAILLMNFYGISKTNKTIDKIRNECIDIQIIEDITHVLFDIEKIYSDQVDYYIGSIRKWVGIVDGALMISNKKNLPEITYKDSNFTEFRRKALKYKEQYNYTKIASDKDKFRRLFLEAENSLDDGRNPILISPESMKLLENLNCSTLKNRRKWNGDTLLNLLKSVPGVKFPINIDQIIKITPFSIPILVKDRDSFQKKLAKKGIYASVLWPLSEDARKKSPFAVEMENSMLSIPIDQRYDSSDMEQIYNTFKFLLGSE
jgi:hypothetical protein